MAPRLARALAALASAVLLVLTCPTWNLWPLAWVALVPWLWLLRTCAPRAAFGWSYALGIVFWLGSTWWMTYVTTLGWVVWCAYLALYHGLFGWAAARLGVGPTGSGLRLLTSRMGLFVLPAIWVALEYLRSHILPGLARNGLLAYTQADWLLPIQIADVTGVWGVSFLLVLVNAAAASLLNAETPMPTKVRNVAVAAACLLASAGYGAWRLPQAASAPPTARVAVVQGNIPQDEKWDEANRDRILRRYEELSREAAAGRPDLIVWPETSVPGYFGIDEALTQRVLGVARVVGVPLLVGAPAPTLDETRVRLMNRAALVTPDGRIAAQYDKVHLVPFGEFIPGEELFPLVRNALPPIGTFSAGTRYTVFTLPPSPGTAHPADPSRASAGASVPLTFSVMICFEDLFPEVASRFVREGARLLLVITNDAWFGPTGAALQHLQASVFRAIEQRMPVVRAANTGWSGCVDAAGRVQGVVQAAAGRTLFVTGTHTCQVAPGGSQPTPYGRWGDWLAALSLLVALGWLLLEQLERSTRPPASRE